MVERPHPGQLFCSNTGEECQHHNRVRCVKDRVGCSLPGGQDRGKVDSNRSRAAHQCAGDEGSMAGNAMLPQGYSRCCSAAKDGQPGSNSPFEQDRRTHLVTLVSDGPTSLGVVPIAEDFPACRTPPWQRECSSRLGVTAHLRQQRLEASTISFRVSEQLIRSLLRGLICQPNQQPAPSVLQLEAGSISQSSGCLLSPMVHRTPLPFPPLQSHREGSCQNSSGSGQLCLLDCTSLASPGLVSSVARDVDEGAYPPSTRRRSSTRPSIIPSPTDSRRELMLTAWPISGKPTLSKAFQAGLPTSFCSPGGATPMQHIIPHGPNGVAGVVRGKPIPFLHLWKK